MNAVLVLLGLVACGPDVSAVVSNLSSDNPTVREDSAKIAQNMDAPEMVAALIKALEDPSDKVRVNAIESLVALEATDAVPALVGLLSDSQSAEVERAVVDALGRLGDPGAAPALLAYVEQRESAPPLDGIWALGALGDPAALALLTRLRTSADPYVAYNADQALRGLDPGS